MYHPRRQFQPSFQDDSARDAYEIEDLVSQRHTSSLVDIETQKIAPVPFLEILKTPPLPSQSPLLPLTKQFAEPLSFAPQPALHKAKKKLHKVRLLFILGSIALLLLLLVLLWLNTRTNTDVTLFQVQKQSITQVVGGGGTLYPRHQLAITYPVRERVLEVLVHTGDSVFSGQPLLRLDTTQSNAQLQQALDTINAAQIYLNAVSISGNTLTIAQAQQQLTLAKNKYTALNAQLSYPLLHEGVLLSPLQGVVTSLSITSGEMLPINSTLLVIMDESALLVHMQVPLAYVGQIHPGQKAQIGPSALSNRTFSGAVNTVIPQANPQTDTFEAWITVDDPQHLLLPGMSTFVSILIPTQALVVPRLSILSLEQLTSVFVVQKQHAYLRPVQVQGRYEDRILISSGLESGDLIVMIGQDKLHNGQPIAVRTIEYSRRGDIA